MRAELAGAAPLKPTSRATLSGTRATAVDSSPPVATPDVKPETDVPTPVLETNGEGESADPEPVAMDVADNAVEEVIASAVNGSANETDQPRGVKRSAEEMEKEDSESPEEEEAAPKRALKVNPDGTVEQEDTVK